MRGRGAGPLPDLCDIFVDSALTAGLLESGIKLRLSLPCLLSLGEAIGALVSLQLLALIFHVLTTKFFGDCMLVLIIQMQKSFTMDSVS